MIATSGMVVRFIRLADGFNSRDRAAVKAYEDDCRRSGQEPTDAGRLAWVREWRDLDEEDRLAAVEAQYEDNLRYRGFEP